MLATIDLSSNKLHFGALRFDINSYLLPANVVCKGNVFTGVSRTTGGGVLCPVVLSQGDPPGLTETPPDREPPGQRPPGQRLPRKRNPRQRNPWTETPPPHTVERGRDASYLNAFLFLLNVLANGRPVTRRCVSPHSLMLS